VTPASAPAPSAVREAALAHVSAMLNELTSSQWEDLAAGRARLVFRAASGSRARRPDPTDPAGAGLAAAVAEINRLSSPSEVAGYLREQRFTAPALRDIARALGPTVSTTGRSKDDLIRDIVAGTAGYRVRSAAMSGGAWS
jgi:hypothetical protein